MPVGRWGWEWFHARLSAAHGVARIVVASAGIACALLYIASALWFDLAYWCLARFAPNRIGKQARTAISVGVAILVVVAISASAARPAAEPATPPSPSAVAAASPSPAPATQLAPSSQQSELALASPTPADADDEAGPSWSPGATFASGPTGVAFVPSGPASPADRLPGEPDPVLTPGVLNPAVTQATIGSTICVSGWTATIRPPSDYTTALKIEQIAQYGYSDTSTADYEEDHLISLELGGSPTDQRNLWPEPYTASLADGRPTGAHTKDGFETRLKYEVCDGTITLAQAQAEIGVHWVHFNYGIPLTVTSPTAGPTGAPAPTAAPTAPPAGTLTVKITSLPVSVSHGSNATMVAVTSPGATCGASVTYASGRRSRPPPGCRPTPSPTRRAAFPGPGKSGRPPSPEPRRPR